LRLESERDYHPEWDPMVEPEVCHFKPSNDLPQTTSEELQALADRYLLPLPRRVNPADGAELVECEGLWFYRYPVTVRQYRKFDRFLEDAPGFGWNNLHPMVKVTFEKAACYAAAMSARLPSEAEWQRLAAGPKGRVYPWVNESDPSLLTFAAKATTWPDRHPDGMSAEGALDLAGNVAEWTSDLCKGKRVTKGGGYAAKTIEDCACAARRLVTRDTLKPWLGFRCVMR